jgi:hypothetical protein
MVGSVGLRVLTFGSLKVGDVDTTVASTVAVNGVIRRIVDVQPLADQFPRETVPKVSSRGLTRSNVDQPFFPLAVDRHIRHGSEGHQDRIDPKPVGNRWHRQCPLRSEPQGALGEPLVMLKSSGGTWQLNCTGTRSYGQQPDQVGLYGSS